MDNLKDLIEKYIHEYLIARGIFIFNNPSSIKIINDVLYTTLNEYSKEDPKEILKVLQDFIKALIYCSKILSKLNSEMSTGSAMSITHQFKKGYIQWMNEPSIICGEFCEELVKSTSNSSMSIGFCIEAEILLNASAEVQITFILTDRGGTKNDRQHIYRIQPIAKKITFTTEVDIMEQHLSDSIEYVMDNIRAYRKLLAKLYESK